MLFDRAAMSTAHRTATSMLYVLVQRARRSTFEERRAGTVQVQYKKGPGSRLVGRVRRKRIQGELLALHRGQKNRYRTKISRGKRHPGITTQRTAAPRADGLPRGREVRLGDNLDINVTKRR